MPNSERPTDNRRHASYEQIGPTDFMSATRKTDLNVLVASTGLADSFIVEKFLPSLVKLSDVSLRAVLEANFRGQDFVTASTSCATYPNIYRPPVSKSDHDELEVAELCEWADVLVFAPIDANTLAKMLHGHADSLILEILRSWDVSKKVLMVPGMSASMWENPMTKKQLSKIRRKWNWIRVFPPILWMYKDEKRVVASWDVLDEVRLAVRNQTDLMNIGKGMSVIPFHDTSFNASTIQRNRFPPELWSMILDYTGDWELAQTLHVYTNISPPSAWASHTSPHGPRDYMEALELTVLRGSLADVKHFIATHGVPRWLSKLCIRLIMRFAMVPLLSELESSHNDLFWATFGHTFLPDKASSVFGRTDILDFWHTSPSFLTKEYNAETLDGASRNGFLNVLQWWQESGLPLKFTEVALEQASAQGHLRVLEWWKNLSAARNDNNASTEPSKLWLKPGKSIVFATQNGKTDVVRWWLQSGIAFSHEDVVAKLASTHGHVDILQLWHELKGNKMIFDNQVLVGATKMGNVGVLEWWKQTGLKVEYKTCDVEEALEDGHEGQRGVEVRRWWARNGLNLGVGTSEWMKTKYLNC